MFEFSKIEFLDWLNIKCKENENFFFRIITFYWKQMASLRKRKYFYINEMFLGQIVYLIKLRFIINLF